MQAVEKNDLKKLQEEHTKRVFELYQSKSKSFRNTLSILLSFALVFLLLILIPYVSIKAENEKLGEHQEKISIEIAQNEEHVKVYQAPLTGIKILQTQISQSPEELREFIRTFSTNSDSHQDNNVCQDIKDEEEYGDCVTSQIRQEIQNQFKEYREILAQYVIEPLQALDDEATILIDLITIEEGIGILQNTFDERIAKDPDYWNTVEGKTTFYTELNNEVDRMWNRYGQSIIDQTKRLNDKIDNLRVAEKQLEQQQGLLQTQKKQMDDRLKQIQFPFGKLPVGLEESVTVFPVILAIGFLVSTSLLIETTRLRGALNILCQRRDPNCIILTDEQITLVAPIWADPTSPNQNQWTQLVILSAPIMVFVVACFLIFYNWTIPDPFASVVQPNRWLYGGLYVLSIVIFVYSGLKLRVELQHYSDRK